MALTLGICLAHVAWAAEPLVPSVVLPSTGLHATDVLPAEQVATVGPVHVLEVRPDLYMLTVSGVNLAVQTGSHGTIVIDTGPSEACDAVTAAIKQVTATPVRDVIDTSAEADRVACNAAVAGADRSSAVAPPGPAGRVPAAVAPVIAYEDVLTQMLSQPGANYPAEALPSQTFQSAQSNFSLNDQGVQVISMPAAHTSGDAMVLFPTANVVITGDIFDETRFPVIQLKLGGSIQGEIAALNRLLNELTVPPTPNWQGRYGTLVIPARGHLCDQADVLNYRDMVTIIRDRVQALIHQGKSLAQVEATDPTRGYEARYGADTGPWTTHDFVEAVYQSLKTEHSK